MRGSRLVVACVGAILVAAGCGRPVATPSPLVAGSPSSPVDSPRVISPGPDAACEPVQTVGPYGGTGEHDTAHATSETMPALDTYASIPPVSGPHDTAVQSAGAYSEPVSPYRVLHSLEHGAVAVWYDPAAVSVNDLDTARAALQGQDHVILSPYSFPGEGGSLPEPVALTAWHHLQRCSRLDPVAIGDFLRRYRTPTGDQLPPTYEGDAPEPGAPI